MLRHCLPQNVTHMLSQLPETLDETYARVLKEIGKTNEFYARRLLQCLTVTQRPLDVNELAEILALDFGDEDGIPELKENWLWKDMEEAVLSTCSSLISVSGDNYIATVQFSHFSVKEFLTSDRLATSSADLSYFHILPEPAHTVLTKACLGVLLQPGYGNTHPGSSSHLVMYAARHWVDHAQFENVWTRVEHGIRLLFDPAKPHLQAWLINSELQHSRFFAGYNLDKPRGSLLYYASLCGLRDMAAHLISENPQLVTSLVDRSPTPLLAALHGGHLDIAELLYEAGADLGIRNDNNMTLLHAVSDLESYRGSADIVKWLFDHEVPDNSQEGSDEASLHLGDANRHRWHGITVNDADDTQRTPLHIASERGNLEMMRELLVRGADITSQDRRHRTPLHCACEHWASVELHSSCPLLRLTSMNSVITTTAGHPSTQ